MQATQASEAIDTLVDEIITRTQDLSIYRNEMSQEDYDYARSVIARLETKLSDLRNLGRNDSEPDVTIDYEDYAQVVRDSDETSSYWVSCEYGHINVTLTRKQHARSINVWRDARNNLMVGRMRISFGPTGRPTATCTHCGLAFTAVRNTIVTAECFTIACIAHGHNDGPAFARAYTIAEQTYYRPIIKGNNIPLKLALKRNAYALAQQALTPVVESPVVFNLIRDDSITAKINAQTKAYFERRSCTKARCACQK